MGAQEWNMGANHASGVKTWEKLKQPSLCPEPWPIAALYSVGQTLPHLPQPPSPPLCSFIFFRSSLFLSVAVGVSVKQPYKQCVSESAEILMVPGVGGWYRACVVTVQRVPSRHQALLGELLNEKWPWCSRFSPLFPFVCVFVFVRSVKLLSPCLTTSDTQHVFFVWWRHSHSHECKSHSVMLSVGGQRGELCYQFILCGLGYKKHPVLWLWKKPVFNFWETHKSLSLLSYWLQNWKQMLHSLPHPFWTGQL